MLPSTKLFDLPGRTGLVTGSTLRSGRAREHAGAGARVVMERTGRGRRRGVQPPRKAPKGAILMLTRALI